MVSTQTPSDWLTESEKRQESQPYDKVGYGGAGSRVGERLQHQMLGTLLCVDVPLLWRDMERGESESEITRLKPHKDVLYVSVKIARVRIDRW